MHNYDMNKKTKFVTAYYAYHANEPFWGQNGRQERYLYSLRTLCNMKEKIVCYTDDDAVSYNILNAFREENGLSNLEIKISPLKDNPYQERVYKIRKSNPDIYDNPTLPKYSRPSQIYWSKFDWLMNEYEPDINLYWIDIGLSSENLFPPYLNEYGHEEDYKNYYRNSGEHKLHAHKGYAFQRAFNSDTVLRINEFAEDKFINLCRLGVTDCDHSKFIKLTGENYDYENIFSIGGFFGGNSNHIPTLVTEAKRCVELILLDEYYLCGDEEILTHLRAKYSSIHKPWTFHTFYHEGYPSIWNSTMIPFHKFFSSKLI